MADTTQLQLLLNNVIELDSTARVVCSIGNATHSSLATPMFYLHTRIYCMDGFMSCGIACHAASPIAVMENLQKLLINHNSAGGTFSIDRRLFTTNNDFSQVCFKS